MKVKKKATNHKIVNNKIDKKNASSPVQIKPMPQNNTKGNVNASISNLAQAQESKQNPSVMRNEISNIFL